MNGNRMHPHHVRRRNRLFCLFLLAALLLNFPLLTLFDRPLLVAGIPLIYLYLFLVWGALIWAVYMATHRRRPGMKKKDGPSPAEPPC